jgi:hypothetical protein
VLVAEEKHKRDGIVEVHLLEVGNLVKVADVDNSKALDAVGDTCDRLAINASPRRRKVIRTIENFILAHAVGIPVTAEAYDYQALFLGKDGLVNMPTSNMMGENDRAHYVRANLFTTMELSIVVHNEIVLK